VDVSPKADVNIPLDTKVEAESISILALELVPLFDSKIILDPLIEAVTPINLLLKTFTHDCRLFVLDTEGYVPSAIKSELRIEYVM